MHEIKVKQLFSAYFVTRNFMVSLLGCLVIRNWTRLRLTALFFSCLSLLYGVSSHSIRLSYQFSSIFVVVDVTSSFCPSIEYFWSFPLSSYGAAQSEMYPKLIFRIINLAWLLTNAIIYFISVKKSHFSMLTVKHFFFLDFAAICVQWNTFMSQLPVGYYLCVRCLRSRRPFIEDVKCACATAAPSLERVLVKSALNHVELAYEEALESIRRLPPSGIAADAEQRKKYFFMRHKLSNGSQI